MIKLIISDMDGSLLNSKKELPPNIFTLIDKCTDKNLEFVIGSGRSYSCLKQMFSPVVDKISFICDNGAYVISKGNTLHVSPIDLDKVRFFINEGRKHKNVYTILCSPTGSFVENIECIPEEALEEINHYYPNFENVDDLLHVEDDILKICFLDLSGAEDNIYPSLKPFSGHPRVVLSADVWVDVVNEDVNKGTGVKILQDNLQCAQNETVIFGDYLNDLEMFENATYSFAPCNAHEQIKKIAYQIIDHHDNWSVSNKISEIINNPNLK